MEQLKQILFLVAMAFALVYTVIVAIELIAAAFGVGKIKKTTFDWKSLGIILLWAVGAYLWFKYFNTL